MIGTKEEKLRQLVYQAIEEKTWKENNKAYYTRIGSVRISVQTRYHGHSWATLLISNGVVSYELQITGDYFDKIKESAKRSKEKEAEAILDGIIRSLDIHMGDKETPIDPELYDGDKWETISEKEKLIFT